MSLTLLKETILPAVFNKDGSKLLAVEVDAEATGQDQFQSSVVFVEVTVQEGGEQNKIPLVVKFEPFNVGFRYYLNTNTQFYNEVLMYSEVLPFMNRNNIVEDTFAKFYHGVGVLGDSDSSVVVLEDLRPSGYRLAEERGFIDYEHLSIAMAKLGRFHALSFAAKKHYPEEFYKLARRLKEVSWRENTTYHPLIKPCVERAVDPLISRGRHAAVLQRLRDRVNSSVVDFMLDLVAAEEPVAVICHGDFCRNNILFHYDQGKPSDVKFFDIATARYSTPAVDIAFFLFLNSSEETRRAHWEDLLKTYHDALSSTFPDTEVPSLEDIRKELRQKAVYGFIHCSFFLPMMLYERPSVDVEHMADAPQENVGKEMAQLGGAEGTKLLSDMVEELVARGCITLQHKFLSQVQ